MILWLDPDVPCRMPHFAHHYVGVGGLVINEKNEILLIKENRSVDKRRWKLPGGFSDPGERLSRAVEREIKEETGVDADFACMLGVREQTNFKYGAADLYVICALTPSSSDLNPNIIDKREVETARWVSLDEITHNDENDPPEYLMFPTAYHFVNIVKH